MTETGWYKGTQKPVRIGCYKRRIGPTKNYSYSWWDGHTWGFSSSIPRRYGNKFIISNYQNLPWCGLTEESR